MTTRGRIFINCDGGLGNRINSLILARALHIRNLPVIVNWPMNSWCEANYSQIFQLDDLHVTSLPLPILNQVVNQGACFFHDDISSKILRRNFRSAYSFNNTNEFESFFRNQLNNVLLYPALIPPWLSNDEVSGAASRLFFNEKIVERALKFSRTISDQGFYGLHLRRTDLNLPPSDIEVNFLISSNPGRIFLICTDSSETAVLFQGRDNVRLAPKTEFAAKRFDAGDWRMTMTDDYGRLYNSNILRSELSVIDAAVDLLLLAQSTMLTFRRSTFTGAARLLRPFIRLSAKTPDLALPDFFLFLNYLETGEMSSFSLEDISSFISLLLKKGLVEEVLRYLKRLRGLHESSLRNTIIYNIVILLAQNTNKSTQMKDAVLEVLKEADIKKILKNP